MDNLAIFGIIMILVMAIALQHAANWFVRLDIKEKEGAYSVFAIIFFAVSCALIYFSIHQCQLYFKP